jgi:shikimate dehydrogenase
MQYLGVIIEPGKRSLSPAFQQAAIDALRLDYRYEEWPTAVDALATRVTGLRAPVVRGANVTVPHKEAVLPLLDDLDEIARKVGAVNTVRNDAGRLTGFNTDVAGFLRALDETGGIDLPGANVVVAGAGGSARAAILALLSRRPASIKVFARTVERSEQLVADLRPWTAETRLEVLVPGDHALGPAMANASLLVNCTPLGTAGTPESAMSPVPAGTIHPQMLVYDLVYRPALTPLLRDAAAAGATTLGGLRMLVHQGAESLRLWTGLEPPVGLMLSAAAEALARDETG